MYCENRKCFVYVVRFPIYFVTVLQFFSNLLGSVSRFVSFDSTCFAVECRTNYFDFYVSIYQWPENVGYSE